MLPSLFVCNTDSLGEQIQRRVPRARVVKTLQTMNCDVVVDPTKVPRRNVTTVDEYWDAPGAPDAHIQNFTSTRGSTAATRRFRRRTRSWAPRRSPCTGAARAVTTSVSLEVYAELAQFNDCRSAPADRVRGEGQHEGHPVLLPERPTVAQDAIVPRSRLDREAHRFEPVYELADVLSLPHGFSLTLPRTLERKAALTQL